MIGLDLHATESLNRAFACSAAPRGARAAYVPAFRNCVGAGDNPTVRANFPREHLSTPVREKHCPGAGFLNRAAFIAS